MHFIIFVLGISFIVFLGIDVCASIVVECQTICYTHGVCNALETIRIQLAKWLFILKFLHLNRYHESNYWFAICFREVECALVNCHHQLPGTHLHLAFHTAENITLDFSSISPCMSLSLSFSLCMHFPIYFHWFPFKHLQILLRLRHLQNFAVLCISSSFFRLYGSLQWSEQLMKDESEKKNAVK